MELQRPARGKAKASLFSERYCTEPLGNEEQVRLGQNVVASLPDRMEIRDEGSIQAQAGPEQRLKRVEKVGKMHFAVIAVCSG